MEEQTIDNKHIELIEFYRSNPVAAARDLLNIDLSPHQRLIVKGMWTRNYSILCLTRGGGKTFMLALFAVLRAMLYPGERIGIIAPTYRQAKFVFAEVEKMYEMSADFRSVCQKAPVKAPESCYVKLQGYNDRPGSVIEALPLGDGGKIRGARYYTIICDELAQIPQDILDVVVRGMMATTKNPMENVRRIEKEQELVAAGKLDAVSTETAHRLVFASTAYFQFNHFWERIQGFMEIFRDKIREMKKLQEAGEEIPPELLVECRGDSPNGGQVPHRVIMDNKRCLMMFNKDDPPEGFMNQESIEEAKREMSEYLFLMEYMCFAGDTPVITPTGVKSISDIKTGDMVLTHKGRFRRVYETMKRRYSGPAVSILANGYNRPIISTPEHPYYIDGDWTPALGLNKGDFLCLPNLKELNKSCEIDISKSCESFLISMVDGCEYIYPKPSMSKLESESVGSGKIFKSSIRKQIKLDRNLGFVFGMYAAEGSIGARGRQTVFSLDGHHDIDLESMVNELCLAISESFGVSPKKYMNRNIASVTINSRIVASFISSKCKGMSDTKTIDDAMLFSNVDFIRGFIRGYWLGDGCINDKPQAIAGCVNLNLLSQIRTALSVFGIGSSIRHSKNARKECIEGRIVSCKPVYELSIKGKDAISFSNFIDGGEFSPSNSRYIYNDGSNTRLRIRSTESIEFDDYVYNIDVEDDNSFSIPIGAVHNCFFPSDSDGFFKRSLLDRAREHREFSCHLENQCEEDTYVMGIDPARSGDNFAIVIGRVIAKKNLIDIVRVLTYNKKNFPAMHSEIRRLVRLYNISEIAMDAGGGGTTIRDLLADADHCPVGEQLILQRDFEEHQYMKGRHILTLIQFSKYDWVHDSNHNMLSDLQHGRMRIASPPPCNANDTCTPAKELADKEIDELLAEMQNIVVTVTGSGRMHWDTPMKNQRKDRYSAALMAHSIANDYLINLNKPIELATGFWG